MTYKTKIKFLACIAILKTEEGLLKYLKNFILFLDIHVKMAERGPFEGASL